jgi:hypothetical protein
MAGFPIFPDLTHHLQFRTPAEAFHSDDIQQSIIDEENDLLEVENHVISLRKHYQTKGPQPIGVGDVLQHDWGSFSGSDESGSDKPTSHTSPQSEAEVSSESSTSPRSTNSSLNPPGHYHHHQWHNRGVAGGPILSGSSRSNANLNVEESELDWTWSESVEGVEGDYYSSGSEDGDDSQEEESTSAEEGYISTTSFRVLDHDDISDANVVAAEYEAVAEFELFDLDGVEVMDADDSFDNQ